jgi:hypothetical protein
MVIFPLAIARVAMINLRLIMMSPSFGGGSGNLNGAFVAQGRAVGRMDCYITATCPLPVS